MTLYNSAVPLDMDKFRSISGGNGGPAKSNRFMVKIDGGPAKVFLNPIRDELQYLCEAAELPGRGFMSTDIRYYGPNFKAPYQSVYEDLNLTFICRDEFGERQLFDDWMNIINPISSFNFEYKNNYAATIKIYQYSDIANEAKTANEANYSFTFEKAYPILVSPQPATWADDNFHRLTVSFTYIRWYRETIDKINPVDGITSSVLAQRLGLLGLEENIKNTTISGG